MTIPSSTYRCAWSCLLAGLMLAGTTSAGQTDDVDRLTATADESLRQLEDRRSELAERESELAAFRRNSFHAEQAALLLGRDAEKAAASAAGKSEQLEEANQTLRKAGHLLDESRQASIQAARDATQSEQNLRIARQNAERAAHAVAQFETALKTIRQSCDIVNRATRLTGDAIESSSAEPLPVALQSATEAVAPLLSRARLISDVLTAKRTDAESKYGAVVQARNEVAANRRKNEQAYAAASRAHFALQRDIVGLQSTQRHLTQQQQEMLAEKSGYDRQTNELADSVEQLEASVAELESAWVNDQERAERALEQLGRFVSFSRVVAPVFARRCASCHNNRSAGGRLNMNSYAALLKGGESGESLVPHDADSSLLMLMIEDGSMPQDADPLAADEMALIRKWIDVGAPLDARAAETAPLFDIMPELPQPQPPATYRVPVPVLAIALSPDGSLLATSGYHEVLLWNTDGTLARRISNVAQRVHDIEFTHDGRTIAVAAGTPGQYGELKLFNVNDGELLTTLVRATDSFYTVSISPNGALLAAAGADRVVRIVDLERRDVVRTLQEHSDAVLDVSWAPDSRRIVTAGQDNVSKVFDVQTGESLETFAEHEAAVFTAAFLPNGEDVVSGGADGKLRVWQMKKRGTETLTELSQNQKRMKEIGGFDSPVTRLVVTESGVVSMTSRGTLSIHDTGDWKRQTTFDGHDVSGFALVWNADLKRIVSGGYDGEVRFWNPDDGTLTQSFVAIPRESTVVSER